MKLVALALLVLVGCGEKGLQFSVGPNTKPEDSTVASVEFKGSAQYAFDLTVDGESFSDIEDYYTQQMKTMKDKVTEAGYDVDRVELAGKLGFNDFIKDMSVFVVSSANTQGKTKIDAQGNFSVSMATSGKSTTFKVRAQKRIQILLVKDEVTVNKLCYNFSAVEMDVVENPILLSNFKTDQTLYECNQESTGIVIPSTKAEAPSAKTLLLNAGGMVSAVWVNGNQLLVDTNGQRRPYLVNGLQVSANGNSESISGDPVGFTKITRKYNTTEMQSDVVIGDTAFRIQDRISYSDVLILRNGYALSSFWIGGFGINLLAVDGARIMGVGRVAGSNTWKAGQLDLVNNTFIAHADALDGLWGNAVTAMVGGVFMMVGGDKILFVAM